MLIENEWKIDEISLDEEFTFPGRLERQLFTQTFSLALRLAKRVEPGTDQHNDRQARLG
jgi:hypothetical protein